MTNDLTNRRRQTWIIGASHGIGEALALELAKRGERLCLSGRDVAALEALRARLNGPHGDAREHLVMPLNVADMASVAHTAKSLQETWGPCDRIIFMAGLYDPMPTDQLDLVKCRQIIEVNLLGAFWVVDAALKHFKDYGTGQLVLCGSVAGYRGLPNAQPYGASKAGLNNLAESLRAEHQSWLDVKLINPGFVKTRLTDKNSFNMPFRISVDSAARRIAKGLEGKGFEIHFPKRFTMIMKLMSILPEGLYFSSMKQKPPKGGQ